MFGILSGGTTIEKDRCSVRCAAPEDIWAARVRLFRQTRYRESVMDEDEERQS